MLCVAQHDLYTSNLLPMPIFFTYASPPCKDEARILYTREKRLYVAVVVHFEKTGPKIMINVSWLYHSIRIMTVLVPDTFNTQEVSKSKWHHTWYQLSLVPRPPPFFVLQFVFSIIHGSHHALPLLCNILNANQRTKNRGGLGTRLVPAALFFYWFTSWQITLTLKQDTLQVPQYTKHTLWWGWSKPKFWYTVA